ncbi:MAG: tetratricopeptide repeat protein [Candidatus Accumulibacter propinquus]
MVYGVLQKAVRDNDRSASRRRVANCSRKFGGTAYAPMAALTTARMLFDAGDAKTAKLQLLWVVENGQDELRDLARLRLATLLLDEKPTTRR